MHGALMYAVVVAGVLSLLGRENAHPLALIRLLVPVFKRASSSSSSSSANAFSFERFFAASAAAAGETPKAEEPSTAMADAIIRIENRRRPRGLTQPGEPDPEASVDVSALAATASVAAFADDPRPSPTDDQDPPAVAEGGVRFSRLLEFRTRQDLFLACRLRSSSSLDAKQTV